MRRWCENCILPGGPQRTAIFCTGLPCASVSFFKSLGRCFRNRTLPTSNLPVLLLKLLAALFWMCERSFSCWNSLKNQFNKNFISNYAIINVIILFFLYISFPYLLKTILSHIFSHVNRLRLVDSSERRSK